MNGTPAKFVCNFCEKEFQRESSLLNHSCEIKRRWINKEERYVKLGFLAYQRFYTLMQQITKDKTYEEFMRSNYYLAFTKFGRHILKIDAINPEGFIDFVIKTQVPIDDWTNDYVYETYVRELCKKEQPEKATERTIELMQRWADETGNSWTDFFRKLLPTQGVSLIRAGRISPWLIYIAPSAQNLLERMSDEQITLVQENIAPEWWLQRLDLHKEEVGNLKKILSEAGL
jgi:hypothetical protein